MIFGAAFYLNRTVPADDRVTSLTEVGSAAAGQNGAFTFNTTHWSVVLAARGESPAAREALEKLCRTYWRPLYAFARQQGYKHEEAEDITQGFFAVLLERLDFDTLRAEKGRLRSYLLMAVKRGKGRPVIPLEDLRTGAETEVGPSDPLTAERIYERRWASTLLEHVFGRLKDDYQKAGNAALFDWLKQLLPDEPDAPSPADIAAKMGMTENAVRQAFHRFRQRYQSLLREEIAHTVATPEGGWISESSRWDRQRGSFKLVS